MAVCFCPQSSDTIAREPRKKKNRPNNSYSACDRYLRVKYRGTIGRYKAKTLIREQNFCINLPVFLNCLSPSYVEMFPVANHLKQKKCCQNGSRCQNTIVPKTRLITTNHRHFKELVQKYQNY